MTPRSGTYRRLLALASCVVVLAAAGCGSDGEKDKGAPIPAAQADLLQRQLGSIQSRLDVGGGACGDITGGGDPNTVAVNQVLRSIPHTVSADVRATLRDGFDRLFRLTDEQCDTTKGQRTETTETPTETETTPTTPTETETTPTTPTETETTPAVPTTPTTPDQGAIPGNGKVKPDKGNGKGQGQGGGATPGVGE